MFAENDTQVITKLHKYIVNNNQTCISLQEKLLGSIAELIKICNKILRNDIVTGNSYNKILTMFISKVTKMKLDPDTFSIRVASNIRDQDIAKRLAYIVKKIVASTPPQVEVKLEMVSEKPLNNQQSSNQQSSNPQVHNPVQQSTTDGPSVSTQKGDKSEVTKKKKRSRTSLPQLRTRSTLSPRTARVKLRSSIDQAAHEKYLSGIAQRIHNYERIIDKKDSTLRSKSIDSKPQEDRNFINNQLLQLEEQQKKQQQQRANKIGRIANEIYTNSNLWSGKIDQRRQLAFKASALAWLSEQEKRLVQTELQKLESGGSPIVTSPPKSEFEKITNKTVITKGDKINYKQMEYNVNKLENQGNRIFLNNEQVPVPIWKPKSVLINDGAMHATTTHQGGGSRATRKRLSKKVSRRRLCKKAGHRRKSKKTSKRKSKKTSKRKSKK